MITIGGGTIRLAAKDDGLNAAGGNDGSSINGRPGQNDFSAGADVWIRITAVICTSNAGGDALTPRKPGTWTEGRISSTGRPKRKGRSNY
jgi:hypothetical protein